MMSIIGQMVAGTARRRSRIGLQVAHILGGILAGGIVGLSAGSIGFLLNLWSIEARAVAVTLLLPLTLLATQHDLRESSSLGFKRQTPQSWAYVLPHKWTSFLNGFDLGLGWATRIYFGSVLVWLAGALALADPVAGTVVGAAFGLTRSSVAVLVAQSRSGSLVPVEQLDERRGRVRVANALALVQFQISLLISVVSYWLIQT